MIAVVAKSLRIIAINTLAEIYVRTAIMQGDILRDNLIFQVSQALCLGCGLCAESCPRQAISLQSGQAQIDQNRCNRCGLCLDACSQGAIAWLIPASRGELETIVTGLKDKANDIIARVERLKNKQGQA